MPQNSIFHFGFHFSLNTRFVEEMRKIGKATTLAASLLAGFGSFSTQADDALFLVPPVTVQEQAANELEAKKIAMEKAKKLAFQELVQMVVPVRAQGNVPSLSGADLDGLIYTTDIPSEQMSQGQGVYVADIQIGFRPDLVRNFFRRHGVAFAETRSRPLLAVPVLMQDGRALLWEDSNDWRFSWATQQLNKGLVPVIQPFGELADIGLLTADEAIGLDEVKLKALARKYGAGGVVLSIADLAASKTSATVSSLVLADGWDGGLTSYEFNMGDGETLSDVYAKAIKVIYSGLQEDWKETNLIDPSATGNSLMVNAPLSSVEDWVKIREALDKLAMVQKYELVDISVENAHLRVIFNGRPQALQSALLQAHYRLQQGNGAKIGNLDENPILDQNWYLIREN